MLFSSGDCENMALTSKALGVTSVFVVVTVSWILEPGLGVTVPTPVDPKFVEQGKLGKWLLSFSPSMAT